MKTLLVAIDFSKNSIHALEYAILYADKLGADVYMIWVDNSLGPDLMIDKPDRASRQESRELFKEILKNYRQKNKGKKLDYRLSKGKVYEEISKFATKINADLIFTGTHAPCPVITIRPNFKFRKEILNILMPIDNTLQSSRKVYVTADIAMAFGAEVQILAVHTSNLGSLKKQVDKHLKTAMAYLDKNGIRYRVHEISTNNVTQDTIDFAIRENVDLVAIMTEQETTQANVFLGTFARQLVNNCPVPVMSVRLNMS